MVSQLMWFHRISCHEGQSFESANGTVPLQPVLHPHWYCHRNIAPQVPIISTDLRIAGNLAFPAADSTASWLAILVNHHPHREGNERPRGIRCHVPLRSTPTVPQDSGLSFGKSRGGVATGRFFGSSAAFCGHCGRPSRHAPLARWSSPGLPFTTLPLTRLHRFESHLFRVLLLRRLHLPLPLSSCGDHHHASCSRAGVPGGRGFALRWRASTVRLVLECRPTCSCATSTSPSGQWVSAGSR